MENVATRGQILWQKCTKFDFGWGSAPDPAGGAHSAPPDPVAGFKGPTSKGEEGRGREEKGRGGKDRREGKRTPVSKCLRTGLMCMCSASSCRLVLACRCFCGFTRIARWWAYMALSRVSHIF